MNLLRDIVHRDLYCIAIATHSELIADRSDESLEFQEGKLLIRSSLSSKQEAASEGMMEVTKENHSGHNTFESSNKYKNELQPYYVWGLINVISLRRMKRTYEVNIKALLYFKAILQIMQK